MPVSIFASVAAWAAPADRVAPVRLWERIGAAGALVALVGTLGWLFATAPLSVALYYAGIGLAALGGVTSLRLIVSDTPAVRRAAFVPAAAGTLILASLALFGSHYGVPYLITYGIVTAGALAAVSRLLNGSARAVAVTSWIFAAAVAAIFGFQLWQAWVLGRFPVRLLGETFVMIALTSGLVALIIEKVHRITVTLPFTAFLTLTFLAVNFVYPEARSRELPPALQSAIFVPHVSVYFIAYGTLITAFATAVASLFAARAAPERAEAFARYSHQFVMFGFPFLTFGIALGCVWGKVAWGDWWFWDPKEDWAFVTWLTYLAYIHLHHMDGWDSRKSAWSLIAGTVVIFITYLAVNYLPTAQQSVHTYSAG